MDELLKRRAEEDRMFASQSGGAQPPAQAREQPVEMASPLPDLTHPVQSPTVRVPTDVWRDTLSRCAGTRSLSDPPGSIRFRAVDLVAVPRYPETQVHMLCMDPVDAVVDLARKGYTPVFLNAERPIERVAPPEDRESDVMLRTNYHRTLLPTMFPLGPGECVFSPSVIVFRRGRDEGYTPLPQALSVACLACESEHSNLRGAFRVAYMYGQDVIVATSRLANGLAFRKVIQEFSGCFRAVVFAVPDTQDLQTFRDQIQQA